MVGAARSAAGGFTTAMAVHGTLADGSQVFLKAVPLSASEELLTKARREIAVNRQLPAGAPAPRLLLGYEDAHAVVLAFAPAPGALPVLPWRPDQLRQVARTVTGLATLTPPPELPSAAALYGHRMRGWAQLAARSVYDDATSSWPLPLAELCRLEGEWAAATAGQAFLHGDVRSDNCLVDPAGAVVLVDWELCCRGVPWLDLAWWAPTVEAEGGCAPEALFALAGLWASAADLLPVVAAIAGYYLHGGTQPDPPGMAGWRPFQRCQAEGTLRWLSRLVAAAG